MKFDTIIIGGGLSGLTAGIELSAKGRRVAIISSGQSALHFSSGSFGLLSHLDGKAVEEPLKAIDLLPEGHPYRVMGTARVAELAARVPSFFESCAITMHGNCERNHWRITPVGYFKPAWLSTLDMAKSQVADINAYGNVAIVSIKGFLDFYPGFLAANLKYDGQLKIASVTTDVLDAMRRNSTEMRATGIAKALRGEQLKEFAARVKEAAGDCDTVIMPSVVGLKSEDDVKELEKLVGKKLACLPTHPISVPGMRIQMLLRRRFEQMGGTYLLGDNVTRGNFEGNRLVSVDTANMGSKALEADNFIVTTGSFFSKGLVAEPTRIYEPVLGCDVKVEGTRENWFATDLFAEQPYMRAGVAVDSNYRVSRGGAVQENVYAAGSILPGANSLKEGSGAGIAVLTAMEVAAKVTEA